MVDVSRPSDPGVFRLGDEVLLESTSPPPQLSIRGLLSSLHENVIWIKSPGGAFPHSVGSLPSGHPVRISTARACNVLVGETSFLHCLGPANRLVAVKRPSELRMVDRRKSLRVDWRHPIGIRIARDSIAGDGGNFGLGMTVDLSLTGIRFETTLHMTVGDHVFISLVLTANESVYALARIVRLDDIPLTSPTDLSRLSPFGPERIRIVAAGCFEAISREDSSRLESLLADLPALSAPGQVLRRRPDPAASLG